MDIIQRSLKNPFVQSFVLFAALVLVGLGCVWAYQNLRTTEYTDSDTGVSVRYSTRLVAEKATAARDITDKIVFRIRERRDDKEGDILVTVRYEDDLRKVSNTLRRDLLDILLENSEKVFVQEYIKYEKVSQRTFQHKGRRAAEIVFSYLSPYGKFVTQRFLILIRDENTAFYLSAQAPKEQYDTMNRRYFNTMFTSIGFK
ncbi:hypothetical protein HY732_03810 [Candidatus Uhrbacteria bacterium]|nr:hypothetical protein [Candidatus Uhrbacteria bacterium]